MENKTFRFKTNINCGGCVASVKPRLDGDNGIREWDVDTANPDKILTVTVGSLTQDEVVRLIEKSGFKAAPLQP